MTAYSENDHPRQPKGAPTAGEFVAKPAGAEAAVGLVAVVPARQELPPMTAVSWFGTITTSSDVHAILLDEISFEDDEWQESDIRYALEASALLRNAGMHDLADTVDGRLSDSGAHVSQADRVITARKIAAGPSAIVVVEDDQVLRTSPNVLVYDSATLDTLAENVNDLVTLADEAEALESFGKFQEARYWADHVETEADRLLTDPNTAVTAEQLSHLASFDGLRHRADLPKLRMRVAEHPNTPEGAVLRLIGDRDWRVRACVATAARHGNLGVDGLAVLSVDNSFDVSTCAKHVWDELAANGQMPSREAYLAAHRARKE